MPELSREEISTVIREMGLQIGMIQDLFDSIDDSDKKASHSLEKRMIVSQGKSLIKELQKK